ncbi:hypothetical protein O181_024450 [Austropuccinia psidii MF-1]|uniref:Uncharacterized protein n=1 Tax=Austropuccinia psidii MF-1 TaxID=1389203 RepID=A0A9Q3H050_9BASI|nr:hypothetical protein [Austropuccinia psidii MF-1]
MEAPWSPKRGVPTSGVPTVAHSASNFNKTINSIKINQKNYTKKITNIKKLKSNNKNWSKSSSQEFQSSTHSDHHYYPPNKETQLPEESGIYSKFHSATPRTNKRELKVVDKLFLDLLERNKINKSTPKSKQEINQSKIDKPSSSKLPSSIEEIHEENLNEETVEGQEEISSTERLHKKILEMKEQLLALIKKEVKKSSIYTPQNSPLEEQTTLPRSFRPHGSPSPYPRPMATSTSYR